jgi:hypothetical protein
VQSFDQAAIDIKKDHNSALEMVSTDEGGTESQGQYYKGLKNL